MVLDQLKDKKIVAVIRADNHEIAKKYVYACVEGGITAVELTYSIPNVCELLAELSTDKQLLLGVGSVLNKKMAEDAIHAGAKYVVSPGYLQEINDVCHSMQILYLPGCMTVTEIMYAMKNNNKMIKLFPGNLFGPDYVKAIKAPIPHVEIMPTGGVDVNNISKWFENGVSCVGVGGSLFASEDVNRIALLAGELVATVKKVVN